MATINEYFEQALLSEASYAKGLQSGFFGGGTEGFPNTYAKALMMDKGKGMSETQAIDFANTYKVIDQYTDPESGFSGTVFENTSGKIFMAIRGTEGASWDDWSTNIGDIGADGIAIEQGIALYNWYQRLITPVGSKATQYIYHKKQYGYPQGTVIEPAHLESFSVTVTASGENKGGGLVGKPRMAVTGHSLGGHLAMIISRIAPEVVTSVLTFNSPGFDTDLNSGDPLTSEGFFNLLRAAEGSNGQTSTSWNKEKIINTRIEGDKISLIGNLPSAQEQQLLFSENINEGLADAHGIKAIVDALAVYNLMAQIDNTLTLDSVAGILKASSNISTYSLESAVATLGTLYVPGFNTRTETEDNTNRDQLYQDINKITATVSSLSGQTVRSLCTPGTEGSFIPLSASAITALAYDNIAYRYALTNLKPFVVIGPDYTKFNKNGELDLHASLTPNGQLTENYLKDRANFLVQLLYENINNTGIKDPYDQKNTVVYSDLPSYYYADLTTGKQSLNAVYSDLNAKNNYQQFIFGSNGSDAGITGGLKADHLYGMGGNDILKGEKGADYLEGGKGRDTLIGGEGDDILFGGNSDLIDDHISDRLEGGLGNDIYHIGDGDIIADTDNEGRIWLNGLQLSIALTQIYEGQKYYINEERKLKAILDDSNTLKVIDGQNSLSFSIENFTSGNFGITLAEYSQQSDSYDITLTGTNLHDEMRIDFYHRIKYELSFTSFPEGVYLATPFYDEILPDNAPTLKITGGGSNDFLFGFGPHDHINGGSGNDIIEGASLMWYGEPIYQDGIIEGDLLEGGAGKDWINGSPGNDIITGGEGDDFLQGYDGIDYIFGDKGNDILAGGAHDTVMLGGDGDDALFGDGYLIRSRFTVDDLDSGYGNFTYHTSGFPAGFTTTNFTVSNDSLEFGDGISWTERDWRSRCKDLCTGNDILSGGAGRDYLSGGDGKDILLGGDDHDALQGDAGDDRLEGGTGNDLLIGDNGDQVETAGDGADSVYGGAGDDQLYGLGGNDFLYGDGNNDLIYGGSGNDFIYGGSGNDTVYGETGDDMLAGGADDDYLSGGDGDDTLAGGSGNDKLEGGAGNDRYIIGSEDQTSWIYDSGANIIEFGTVYSLKELTASYASIVDDNVSQTEDGTGLWIKYGVSGNVLIENGRNNSSLVFQLADGTTYGTSEVIGIVGGALIGSDGDDTLLGGNNNDTYYSSTGNDTLTDTGGNDIYHLQGLNFIDEGSITTIQDMDGAGSLWLDGAQIDGTGIQRIADNSWEETTGSYRLVLSGGDLLLTLKGHAGKVIIKNFGSKDSNTLGIVLPDSTELPSPENNAPLVTTPPGDTTITTGSLLEYTIASTTFTDPDNDPLSYSASLTDGSPLPAWLDFDAASGTFKGTPPAEGTFSIRLTATDNGGLSAQTSFTVSVIQTTEGIGSDGDDSLEGSPGNDSIRGLAGDDILSGGDGNDSLEGGADNDSLIGGAGDDTLYGGRGKDVLTGGTGMDRLYGDRGNDRISGGTGDDLLQGGRGNDSVYGGMDNDTVYGGRGSDFLSGDDGMDILKGEGGSDYLTGGAGNDTLYGGKCNDIILGNEGNDLLQGDQGNDVLDGGEGSDTFYGNQGEDIFVLEGNFTSKVIIDEGEIFSSNDIDTIVDFTHGEDHIQLSGEVFAALGEDELADNLFAANATGSAMDADDRILYNTESGTLFYDADGSGNQEAVQFATLNNKTELHATDFLIA